MIENLILVMAAHILWCAILYGALTIFRAPKIWGLRFSNFSDAFWQTLESKTSANLSNQFEFPLFFYVACLIVLIYPQIYTALVYWLSLLFIVGRVLHSIVQILTSHIRLRGLVFSINFIAVFLIWVVIVSNIVAA